ncbi:MAG: tyrosine-type recombinase/integrase [Limisphaerales bacterium]
MTTRPGTCRGGDFHSLRYTWATFLQRNGVAQRFAMKLMRHSDIKLTAKVYTDEMQLPIYDAIKNLPRLDAVPGYTQIRAQIQGNDGRDLTHVVNAWAGLPAAFKAAILAIVNSSERGASEAE